MLSALSPPSAEADGTKHLILIGDHKQLRPKVETYGLSAASRTGYNLDVSLFERLVSGGLPSSRLAVQHRMRPSISQLIRAQTYPGLIDHESVLDYPNVLGVSENVVFIDHDHIEDGPTADDLTTSRSNEQEAVLSVELVRFFLLQGYRADQIVVLTPYLGQLFQIIGAMHDRLRDVQAYLSEQDIENLDADELAKLNDSRTNSVRCSSIDNYQGEESDIVIVSLVRSNSRGSIGFLKEPQRVNVLLSRARHGMFILGNAATLERSAAGKAVWGTILAMLGDNVMRGLPSVCQLHPEDEPVLLKSCDDFAMIRPNGGCNRPCRFRLSCGHVCPQMCHPMDQSHRYAQTVCCEPCRRCPPNCPRGHQCTKRCKDDCGSCLVRVGPTALSCGHEAENPFCYDVGSPEALEIFSGRCREKVEWTFQPCGHKEETECGNSRSRTPLCPAKCTGVREECSHPCENRQVHRLARYRPQRHVSLPCS